MFSDDDLKKLEDKINRVEQSFLERISKNTIGGEEAITERLIQMLELAIDGFKLSYNAPSPSFGMRGASSSQKTATLKTTKIEVPDLMGRSTVAKGPESEESISGADAIIVLKSEIPHIKANKGFLFQAKKHNGRGDFRSIGTSEIKKQCQKMLDYTSSAYAIVYHPDGFYCFDCKSMNAKGWSTFHRDQSISLAKIIGLFMKCEVGDHKLNAIDTASFADFLADAQIDQNLVISTE